MRFHQQFDLNLRDINVFGRELLLIPPYIIEELVTNLTKKGYTVLKSSAYYMGVPQSITLIKDIATPFAIKFSIKAKNDFDTVCRALGIEKLFE